MKTVLHLLIIMHKCFNDTIEMKFTGVQLNEHSKKSLDLFQIHVTNYLQHDILMKNNEDFILKIIDFIINKYPNLNYLFTDLDNSIIEISSKDTY